MAFPGYHHLLLANFEQLFCIFVCNIHTSGARKIDLNYPVDFTTERSKAVVLVLLVLSLSFWLLAKGIFYALYILSSIVVCLAVIYFQTQPLVFLL